MKVLSLVVLGAVGALSWSDALGVLATAQAPDLARIPRTIGVLDGGVDLAVPAAALGGLVPDACLYRRYAVPGQVLATLFVTYFARGQSWEGAPHDAAVCFRAAGWRELGHESVVVADGGTIRVSTLERGGDRIRLAHWTQYPGCRTGLRLGESVIERVRKTKGLRADAVNVYLEVPAVSTISGADLARSLGLLQHAIAGLLLA